MTPAACLFLAALTAVCALSVWVNAWRTDVDDCDVPLERRETV